MYCKYCGKEITESHFNNGVCMSCMQKIAEQQAAAEQQTVAVATPKVAEPQNVAVPTAQEYSAPETEGEPRKNSRMLGFGKALAGTIIGEVGIVITLIIYIFLMVGAMSGMYDAEVYYGAAILAAILIIPAVICTVLPFIFGIKSIGTFRKATEGKPIATLILGIYSLFCSALSLEFLLYGFMMMAIGLISVF